MNKNIKIVFGLFLFFGLFLSGEIVSATTGGPTFIDNLKYNPQNESVYFIQYDHGGRGCPPELMKISLVDGKTDTVFSCDKGIEVLNTYSGDDYEIGLSKVLNEINKIVVNYQYLTPINIKKNNIAIDLQFIKSENFEFDPNIIRNSTFNATISQNGEKIIDNKIYGCSTEQPFTFAGYSIPNFDKKIVLLMSAKGDCLEGGYTSESLMVVGGLDNLIKESVDFYKGDDPLVPNEGTLTVYADNTDSSVKNNLDEKSEKLNENLENNGENDLVSRNLLLNRSNIILFIIVSILIGFILGRVTKRNKVI